MAQEQEDEPTQQGAEIVVAEGGGNVPGKLAQIKPGTSQWSDEQQERMKEATEAIMNARWEARRWTEYGKGFKSAIPDTVAEKSRTAEDMRLQDDIRKIREHYKLDGNGYPKEANYHPENDTEHSREQKASAARKPDSGMTADVETIQRELEKRNLYHYKVDGDWGSRSNRGMEKLIVQAQIEGQKNGSYTGKVNGEYNAGTRAAMEHMGVSAEALAALDRLQSTHELQALYHPSGDAMQYKTASLTPGFHESASGSAAPAQQATVPPQQPAAASRPPRPV